jgi:hypothetical protein
MATNPTTHSQFKCSHPLRAASNGLKEGDGFKETTSQGEGMTDVEISGVMPHYIDPTIEHVGVSKLRQLNAVNLGKLKNMLVVRENDTALAVVIRYEQYLEIQNQLEQALRTIQAYRSEGLMQGLHDSATGKIKRMSEVDPAL